MFFLFPPFSSSWAVGPVHSPPAPAFPQLGRPKLVPPSSQTPPGHRQVGPTCRPLLPPPAAAPQAGNRRAAPRSLPPRATLPTPPRAPHTPRPRPTPAHPAPARWPGFKFESRLSLSSPPPPPLLRRNCAVPGHDSPPPSYLSTPAPSSLFFLSRPSPPELSIAPAPLIPPSAARRHAPAALRHR